MKVSDLFSNLVFNSVSKLVSNLVPTSVLVTLVAFSVAGCGGAVNAHIGGTVTGLASGNSVGLTNNNTETITVKFNSSDNSFEFNDTVGTGLPYNVTVSAQPTGQTCSVVKGTGTVDASGGDVTNIEVTCVAGSGVGVPVFATVVGLQSGKSITLLLNGDSLNPLVVTFAGGVTMLAFPKTLLPDAGFVVSIGQQPSGQSCSIGASGTGFIPKTGGGSPSPVVVSCV